MIYTTGTMLVTSLAQFDRIASGLFGLLLILALGVVGVLIIVLLMIAWRRSVLRGRAREQRVPLAVPDAWSSAAQRLPGDRPQAPPRDPGPDADAPDDDLPDEPDFGRDLPYHEHFDHNETEPDQPYDDPADDLDDSLGGLDDDQDDRPDDPGFPDDGETDDEDNTTGDDDENDDDDRPPRFG